MMTSSPEMPVLTNCEALKAGTILHADVAWVSTTGSRQYFGVSKLLNAKDGPATTKTGKIAEAGQSTHEE